MGTTNRHSSNCRNRLTDAFPLSCRKITSQQTARKTSGARWSGTLTARRTFLMPWQTQSYDNFMEAKSTDEIGVIHVDEDAVNDLRLISTPSETVEAVSSQEYGTYSSA